MLGREFNRMPSSLVLIAALNEEAGIGLTIEDFKQHLGSSHFLVVDGNSVDRTVHVAKDLGADVIFQQGKGKGNAIASAFKYIGECDLDYVVMTDADYTYPGEFVPHMIQVLEDNPKVGMVCGNRFNSRFPYSSGGGAFYFGNKALCFAHNLMNGIALNDPLTGLRAMRWEALRGWKPKSDGFDIEVELNHHIEREGFEIVEIDIPYRSRVGEKKLKVRHGLEILNRIIKESLY